MGSIRNINYIKSKTKENLNISITQKKQKTKKQKKTKNQKNKNKTKTKTKTQIHEVLQLPYSRFHILKSLHNIFIINSMSYISFNIYSQAIIHPLISHLMDLFQVF